MSGTPVSGVFPFGFAGAGDRGTGDCERGGSIVRDQRFVRMMIVKREPFDRHTSHSEELAELPTHRR
jgi:hypothetical protein